MTSSIEEFGKRHYVFTELAQNMKKNSHFKEIHFSSIPWLLVPTLSIERCQIKLQLDTFEGWAVSLHEAAP